MLLATGANAKEMRNYYGYTLGLALARYNLDFHAGCAMGNHHHVDVTDVLGNRPAFKTSLHGNLARGLNAKHGRFGQFWEPGGSCDTCQPTDDETLQDLAYTEANAVVAGLVKRAGRWPGFTSYGWKFGETRTFTRPDWYYDPHEPDNPPEITVTRVRPKIFPELSDAELDELLRKRVRERELAKHDEMRATNRRFMGERKLAKQRWDRRPSSPKQQFGVIPKVVASSGWKRRAEIQRNRAWEREYAAARDERQKGGDPVFPFGTYAMRLHGGVRVAQGPP